MTGRPFRRLTGGAAAAREEPKATSESAARRVSGATVSSDALPGHFVPDLFATNLPDPLENQRVT